jgi:hypothetical protein
MLTRRIFNVIMLSLGTGAFPRGARGQQDDTVTVRIRVDESVRAVIPPISQGNLTIERDQSEEAKELARRSPETRAVPIILIIVGTIAVTELLQMIKELLRQTYYGGVVIDTRSQPTSVTSDPKIPANMVFVIDVDGKTRRFTNDQFSLDILRLVMKVK